MAANITVAFDAQAFPKHVAKSGMLTFSANDLAHALFVTGRAPADQWYGVASVWEFIHRSSVIPAYLRRSSGGPLHKSALAQDLDRSEKVGLSYALGQAMTTIYCRHQLQVDYIMHLDRYALRYNVQFGPTKKRPDLFGFNPKSNKWIVAEAKGRSNTMEKDLPARIKKQKSAIKTINGVAPAAALGCVASFPVKAPGYWGPMRVDAVDPEPAENASALEVDLGGFLRAYYEPFLVAIASGSADAGDDEYVASVIGPGMRVGLHRDIYDSLITAEGPTDAPIALPEDLPTSWRDGSQFPDGTLLEVEWADAMAIQDYEG